MTWSSQARHRPENFDIDTARNSPASNRALLKQAIARLQKQPMNALEYGHWGYQSDTKVISIEIRNRPFLQSSDP
jgi:hypothetical protein